MHPPSHHRALSASLLILATSQCPTPAVAREIPYRTIDRVYDGEEPPPLAPPSKQWESESLIAMQFTPDPYAHRDRTEMILSGELVLAAIRYSPSSFATEDDGGSSSSSEVDNDDDENDSESYYTNVDGEFCIFRPSDNRKDPSVYPTISSVMSESEHCREHRYTIPLTEVMQAVRAHDNTASSAGDGNGKVRHLPLSGMLFHQGYAGAGLISNAITSFDSNLVISEHAGVRDALSACDVIRNRHLSTNCSIKKQQRLIRDVITLLSRIPSSDNIDDTNSTVQRLYLKLSSASSAYLSTMRYLYPQAKWAFVYRSTAEHALAKTMGRSRKKSCIKSKRNPSSVLSNKSSEYNINVEQLSHHEMCALYLSTFAETALQEHEESGTGMLLSYEIDIAENVDTIVDVILPYFGMQGEIDSDPQGVRDRVSGILSMKSNASGRFDRKDKMWTGERDVQVTEEVIAASELFMMDSMESIMRMRR